MSKKILKYTSIVLGFLVLLIITKTWDVFPTRVLEPLDLIGNDPEVPLK